MDEEKLRELIYKYQRQECSERELRLLEAWYDAQIYGRSNGIGEEQVKQDLEVILKKLPGNLRARSFRNRLSVAASLFISLALAITLYHCYLVKTPVAQSNVAFTPIVKTSDSGLGKSFLTLADGKKISLNEAPIGIVATQHGIQVRKLKKDVIMFSNVPNESTDQKPYNLNVLTTSRGAQVQVVLPDHTRIWVNAASSLKFPSIFTGKKRHVELDGEAYFEVSKNKFFPFEVQTRLQQVQVLGTHFNICSYTDEPNTRTTLLEGKVKVLDRRRNNGVILKPGEQASLNAHKDLEVRAVDAEDAIAWKSGLFQFRNSDLESVSRQLARWYGVDFKLDGKLPKIKLWGEVRRNESFEKALELLTFFDLDFKVVNEGGVKKVLIKSKNKQHVYEKNQN